MYFEKKKKRKSSTIFGFKGRHINFAVFCYSAELTLLSYCPPKTKKKIVRMFSTVHGKGDEPNTTKLPEIIKFYNSTKGVDTLDQMCHNTYSTGRKTITLVL